LTKQIACVIVVYWLVLPCNKGRKTAQKEGKQYLLNFYLVGFFYYVGYGGLPTLLAGLGFGLVAFSPGPLSFCITPDK
jgi:hypothetical protein